ncbi:MAG TPA: cyclic nucleotide-binding domain-containing protein [Anaerolineales bacterium]|nr:cyclic nucleotide-binding domain-containing protein [Anaerolineales bacterium]
MSLPAAQPDVFTREGPILVEVRGLAKSYPTPSGDFFALKDIDVQIGRGEFVAVIGKSGSGKTTFINMLAGIDRPTRGEIHVNGAALHTLTESGLAAWRGVNLGIVFQFFQLLPTLTVIENIILPMELNRRYSKNERRAKALELLDLVEMASQADKLPSEVSGGQQQRAAIARALANDPPLIIADEPTGNLDSRTAEKIIRLFERLVAGGKTILMVTHDNDLARRVDRTILIADGEVVNEYLVRALSTLDADKLLNLKMNFKPKEYAPGTTIVRQGELSGTFYIVTEGQLNVYIDQPGGERLLVNRLKPGSYFGEMAVLRRDVRSATVQVDAGSKASLIELDAGNFTRVVRDSPELLGELEETLEKRTIAMNLQSLAEVEPEVLNEIARDQAIREFRPGETIIRQGQIGKTFFILIEGAVEVFVERPDGQHVHLTDLAPGQMFGEQALLGPRRRNATVRATGDRPARVVELPAEDLRRLIDRSPVFRNRLRDSVDARAKTQAMRRPDLEGRENPPDG